MAIGLSRRHWVIAGAFVLLFAAGGYLPTASLFRPTQPSVQATKMLVLGDSQLSFGAGPVLSVFFEDLPNQCRAHVEASQDIELLAGKSFAMIGTRSTSLQSWTTTGTRAWELLCHKDKRWGVNASAWGTVKPVKARYIQVGEGENFQFCKLPETPLQNLLASGYYAPELLMIFVGGNGAARLARDPSMARRDVNTLIAGLPDATGCVFMMTAPVYEKRLNDDRLAAQANLRAAFMAHGNRCSFVDGHTTKTRAAIEGQARFFKRREDGSVKDPYHANKHAAQRFLDLRRGPLCRALADQLRRRRQGGASYNAGR